MTRTIKYITEEVDFQLQSVIRVIHKNESEGNDDSVRFLEGTKLGLETALHFLKEGK